MGSKDMSKARICGAAVVAAAIVVSVSASAEAFCHKYRSVPVWFGVYYPNCGPCGGCIMPYVASGAYGGYGYCGIGCGCGYAYGCGHGCVKAPCRWAAHKACKRMLRGCGSCFGACFVGGCGSDCGLACGTGCGDGCGGCGDGCSGGCSGCAATGGEAGEVLYDGPAPAETNTPPMPQDPSASAHRPLIMLAGLRNSQGGGSADFEQGLSAYHNGSLDEAARQFEQASSAEPNNALYHYYRALTLHDLYGADAAEDARQQAVEAELREPIQGWGKRMERVQGRSRLWIEKARRQAGLVR
jgi:hypothetical protein